MHSFQPASLSYTLEDETDYRRKNSVLKHKDVYAEKYGKSCPKKFLPREVVFPPSKANSCTTAESTRSQTYARTLQELIILSMRITEQVLNSSWLLCWNWAESLHKHMTGWAAALQGTSLLCRWFSCDASKRKQTMPAEAVVKGSQRLLQGSTIKLLKPTDSLKDIKSYDPYLHIVLVSHKSCASCKGRTLYNSSCTDSQAAPLGLHVLQPSVP